MIGLYISDCCYKGPGKQTRTHQLWVGVCLPGPRLTVCFGDTSVLAVRCLENGVLQNVHFLAAWGTCTTGCGFTSYSKRVTSQLRGTHWTQFGNDKKRFRRHLVVDSQTYLECGLGGAGTDVVVSMAESVGYWLASHVGNCRLEPSRAKAVTL